MDKLDAAKQRRERLEEEERKRREDAMRRAAEREQRAAMAKNNRALILEKGKQKAEKLAKQKQEEARRRKATASTTSSSSATASLTGAHSSSSSVLPTPVAPVEKKAGIRNPFKLLKQKTDQHKQAATPVSAPAPLTPVPASRLPSLAQQQKSPAPGAVRPSPLRKRASPEPPSKQVAAANTTQYSISPYKPSDSENDDSSARKKGKREARWARREALMPMLQTQRLQDADDVFGGPVGLTCNLHEIFDGYKPKKKHAVRGSSAAWSDMGGTQSLLKK